MSESPLSPDDRYRARPTVRVDGRDLVSVSARVNSFVVRERVGGPSALELRLNNFSDEGGYQFEDERDLRLGSQLAIYSGDERQPREVFRGVVSSFEAEFPASGPAELVVLAEDPLQRARMARGTQVRDNVTLANLAGEVARDLQLTPVVSELTDNIGTQVQLNESKLAFLRRLLASYDADLQVVGTELHVSPRASVQRGVVELTLHGQLREARFRVDLSDQVTEITTSGWDPARGERIAGSSSGAQLGPGSGRTGADTVRDVFGERREHVAHPAVIDAAEAGALAASAFHERARRFVVLEGRAEGNPLIRVGTHVRVSGASNRFDNTYYVVAAGHLYEPIGGYVTEFEAECSFLGAV
jgi:uncharacterized protein